MKGDSIFLNSLCSCPVFNAAACNKASGTNPAPVFIFLELAFLGRHSLSSTDVPQKAALSLSASTGNMISYLYFLSLHSEQLSEITHCVLPPTTQCLLQSLCMVSTLSYIHNAISEQSLQHLFLPKVQFSPKISVPDCLHTGKIHKKYISQNTHVTYKIHMLHSKYTY